MADKRIGFKTLRGRCPICVNALLGLALGWAVLVGYGCKEKIEPEPLRIHQEIKDFCSFATGSYWVYEEEGTPGWFDSCYVQSRDTIIAYDEANSNYEEAILIWIMMNGIRNQWAITIDDFGHTTMRTISVLKHAPQLSNNEDWRGDLTFFSDDLGIDTLLYDQTVILDSRLDSITFGTETYFDIIRYTKTPPQSALMVYESTWARHVGIVQRRMLDGTTWVLRRYSVRH